MDFEIGVGQFDKEEKVLSRGITHGTSLNKNVVKELFEILDSKILVKVHEFMKKHHSYEELYAYCPK